MKKLLIGLMILANLDLHAQIFPSGIERQRIDKLELASGHLFSTHSAIFPSDPHQSIENVFKLVNNNNSLIQADVTDYLKRKVYQLYGSPDSLHQQYTLTLANKTLWNYFYKDGQHLFSIYKNDFQFTIDPLLDLNAGWQKQANELLWTNRRGIRIQTTIDKRVHIYSDITDNQMTVPFFVDSFVNLYQAFPGAGLFKKYTSKILNIKNGYDFLLAEGGVNFKPSKHISMSLGHGKHFIGKGIRSLFLSDFSGPQFYLRFNTNIWRLHYQNLFMELSPETLGSDGNRLLPKKYTASHYLSVQLTKNWNIGLFESVVFARDRSFELQYLNPVILYRFIEHALGSPDNVFLGFHTHVNLRKSISLYTQLLFDEFLLKEMIKQNGWWGNKYGIQLGAKYINAFGVHDLNLQTEVNWVRPYTYTFRDSFTNYSHFNQAVSHPLGANFKEFIVSINYRPFHKFYIENGYHLYQKGLDNGNFNYGGNILKNYNTRIRDYQNTIGQGTQNKVLTISLKATYELLPECYLDLNLFYRNNELELKRLTHFWFTTGFRMNLDHFRFEF